VLAFPFLGHVGPSVVFGLVDAVVGLRRDAVEDLIEIDIFRALQRPSLFESAVAAFFHCRNLLSEQYFSDQW